MQEHELNKIIATIQAVTKETVNGKIDELTKIVKQNAIDFKLHAEAELEWKDKDKKWKDEIAPNLPYLIEYTEISKGISWVDKVIRKLSAFILALLILWGLNKYFK